MAVRANEASDVAIKLLNIGYRPEGWADQICKIDFQATAKGGNVYTGYISLDCRGVRNYGVNVEIEGPNMQMTYTSLPLWKVESVS